MLRCLRAREGGWATCGARGCSGVKRTFNLGCFHLTLGLSGCDTIVSREASAFWEGVPASPAGSRQQNKARGAPAGPGPLFWGTRSPCRAFILGDRSHPLAAVRRVTAGWGGSGGRGDREKHRDMKLLKTVLFLNWGSRHSSLLFIYQPNSAQSNFIFVVSNIPE